MSKENSEENVEVYEDIKEDALEYYECLSEKARQGVETIRNEYEKFKQKRDGDSSTQIEGEL